jgi:hypothetical protein
LRDLWRLTHSKSVCRDFGCIGHCFCKTFSNYVSLFPNFLPCGLRSTAATSWSSLRFRFCWPLSKWPLPLPYLSLLRLGKWSFFSSSWSAHRAIMSRSSTAVVGRLRSKSWSVLLALVEVAVAVALLVAVALGEVVVLLILLVSPPCHHVT